MLMPNQAASLARRTLLIGRQGMIRHAVAAALQERWHSGVVAGELPEALLLLELLPVYTCGRRSIPEELPLGSSFYRQRGIDVVKAERGGKVTYHGPGQLVGYAIMRVDDVSNHVRRMERAIVTALGEEGVRAATRPGGGLTGVWVQERKIASIGIRRSRGVTTHGFAVNVENDLKPFDWVIPCGLPNVRMTSIAQETGRGGAFGSFREHMAHRFCEAYERSGSDMAPVDVHSVAAGVAIANARSRA